MDTGKRGPRRAPLEHVDLPTLSAVAHSLPSPPPRIRRWEPDIERHHRRATKPTLLLQDDSPPLSWVRGHADAGLIRELPLTSRTLRRLTGLCVCRKTCVSGTSCTVVTLESCKPASGNEIERGITIAVDARIGRFASTSGAGVNTAGCRCGTRRCSARWHDPAHRSTMSARTHCSSADSRRRTKVSLRW